MPEETKKPEEVKVVEVAKEAVKEVWDFLEANPEDKQIYYNKNL